METNHAFLQQWHCSTPMPRLQSAEGHNQLRLSTTSLRDTPAHPRTLGCDPGKSATPPLSLQRTWQEQQCFHPRDPPRFPRGQVSVMSTGVSLIRMGSGHHNPLARSWPCAHHGTEVKCSNSPWGLKSGVYKRKIWLLAELWGSTWTHTTTLKVTCYTAQCRQSPFRDWKCKRLQNQERGRSQEANPRRWHLQGISLSLCLGLLNGTLYRWIYIYRI